MSSPVMGEVSRIFRSGTEGVEAGTLERSAPAAPPHPTRPGALRRTTLPIKGRDSGE